MTTSDISADWQLLRPGLLGTRLLTLIQKDPLGAASRLQRQFGDVARLNILFRRIHYCFSPEAVRQILVEHQADFRRETRTLKIFQTFQGRNVLTTEGPDWERQRRILAPGFAPKRITGYMELMAAAVADRVSSELPAEAGGSVTLDAGAFTTRITMDVILRALFSHPTSQAEADAMSRAIRALTRQSMRELFWPIVPPQWLPFPGRTEKLKYLRIVDRFIDTHIKARSSAAGGIASGQDVLSMMLEARDDQPTGASATLTSQEIHDNCIVLFGAGFDTSASALTWWIGLMATHPVAADRLRGEMDLAYAGAPPLADIARLPYLNATLKEAMRLYPPSSALFTRVALRDVTIAGTPVARPRYAGDHSRLASASRSALFRRAGGLPSRALPAGCRGDSSQLLYAFRGRSALLSRPALCHRGDGPDRRGADPAVRFFAGGGRKTARALGRSGPEAEDATARPVHAAPGRISLRRGVRANVSGGLERARRSRVRESSG